jgi:hypothetical protein
MTIPADIHSRAVNLAWIAPSHRDIPAQGQTRAQLYNATVVGDTSGVIAGLHAIVRTFQRDIAGGYVPERLNWTLREARALLSELEGVKESAA